MNNVLLIILTLIFVAILFAINTYILKTYEHTDDKGFFNALYCKILIVFGSTLFQAQALLVPLDVANESALIPGGLDMKSFWYLIYIVVLVFICILLPFALFFYETDGDEGICKRFLKSVGFTFVANIVSILVLFISYNFLKYADLPVHTITSINYNAVDVASIDFNKWGFLASESDITF
jgi:LMBR1 domain-containing protein 1